MRLWRALIIWPFGKKKEEIMNAHSCLLPVILLMHYQNTHSITHTLLQLTYQHTLPRYKYQYSLEFTIIINYCSTKEQARVPIIIEATYFMWSNMSTPARIIAVGFATFLPAIWAYVCRAPCNPKQKQQQQKQLFNNFYNDVFIPTSWKKSPFNTNRRAQKMNFPFHADLPCK